MGNHTHNGNRLMQNYFNLMRWDKPVGTWLLFWPCSWGITLAAAQNGTSLLTTLNLLALFFLGSLIMRSAGCVINDLWDRKIDAKVERTRNRPLANGDLSILQALILLALLLSLALLIVYQLRIEVFWLALVSLPLVISYPLMKRITWWPQAFLGLTFNFGAVMGWVAVNGEITISTSLLYLSGIYWTLGYDTIYAFQDIADDIKIGVKSTARRLEKHAKLAISLFYGISFSAYIIALLLEKAPPLILLTALVPLYLMVYQLRKFDPKNPENCLILFKQNVAFGFSIFMTIFLHFTLQ
ncbi:MAG: 4-hydroxybenzoate octaprenyltransferase [Rickettsiales bacterium]|nr:4-hydroxybenzoate octaprenyltransferase [Rickettsiales bacterium]